MDTGTKKKLNPLLIILSILLVLGTAASCTLGALALRQISAQEAGVSALTEKLAALTGGEETCSAWVWDLSSETVEQTVNSLPRYDAAGGQGVLDLGGRYALEIDSNGQAAVLDWKTGTRSAPIEGFTFVPGTQFLLSPSRDRACCFLSGEKSGSLDVTQLGFLDFTAGRFILFDRVETEQNLERSLGWLDDSRVFISAQGADSGLFLYTFR